MLFALSTCRLLHVGHLAAGVAVVLDGCIVAVERDPPSQVATKDLRSVLASALERWENNGKLEF